MYRIIVSPLLFRSNNADSRGFVLEVYQVSNIVTTRLVVDDDVVLAVNLMMPVFAYSPLLFCKLAA